jgi:hypothetical protein
LEATKCPNIISTLRAGLDGGDPAAFARAKTAVLVALHHLDVSRELCEAADKLSALLESQLAAVADEKLRSSTNAATLALADELLEAGRGYDASTALLSEVCTRALAVTQEAHGLVVFTSSSMIEVKVATEVVAEEIRQHGRAVLNKLAPAAMPKVPEPPAKVVTVEKLPLVRVFATRPLKWLDDDGKQRACGKYVDCELPAATGKRALASSAALELSNPARKANLGTWPGNFSLGACYDLDAAGGALAQHDPIVHSAFQPIDRGPPFKLKIAGAAS